VGDAVERARAGDGGGVVECLTYRLGDHTTADDAARYRPKEEVDAAWKKEPIRRLRTWLESQAAWDAQKEQTLQAECAAWINAEAEAYAATAAPPVTDMFDYTFAELPEDLAAQRAAAVAIEEGH
jgi:pyruvate dehydrogenase E1 component alpha subunit